MATFLVTGGAGFIGSHLCERLAARGDGVVVLDNFNDFYDPAVKRANAAALDGVEVVEGDIRDAQAVDRLFSGARFDAVIHLAAMAGVRPSLADPLHYEDVNVRGTLVLLEAVRRSEGTRMVFASSSSVYGENEKVPFEESDDIHRPVSPYAATKRAGELHCFTYHHLYGIPTTCLRFFTVYGPRQRPEMAIHKFVRAVLAGEPIPVFGDGSTRRDYTYVDDIVDGVVRAVDRCEGYEIYNLGGSQTTSLGELVDLVGRACAREPIVAREPMQPGDVVITYADVSKACERLGYAPTTPVPVGLARFVDWYRQREGGG
ncbi:MAG: SDR family NAD(P)-dependent oxidoreductase [Planctomycetota bacterium]|jgi:UDP-glucuronate 4-epimerase|nr:SDR family NAD(P)-dependent oxidoreductase [Planctomycetota bacterium]MDP6763702.1 SDR family NAD(P)-dependent oxidoreductase [Planctomycetota bacterium]MDP6990138.1 SDR family NAD(P)-dependent oxidoreductase [Planctomycetota bacterium]